MESNREEAEKCIKIAAQAFEKHKTQRSKNFINKAEKLYPSQVAKDLLQKVKDFDNEQQVYRILRCTNHYEVLEVSRDATDNDIVDAFKKLAKIVHPDKNHTRGATEAFVKIEDAKSVLADPSRRSLYNLSMSNDLAHESSEDDDPPDFEDEASDEEDNSKIDLSSHKYKKWWVTRIGQFILAVHPLILLILIPAVILGLRLVLSMVFRPSETFSLSPNENFTIRRRTVAGKISYYVTTNYAADLIDFYQGSLAELEKEVKLTYACEKEKDYKKSEIKAAFESPHRNSPFWDEWYSRAKLIETPSCTNLEILTKNRPKTTNFRIF